MMKRNLPKIFIALCMTFLLVFQTIGIPAFAVRSAPSDWAENEIAEAKKNGLITYSLAADYSQTVTREMFCELVVKLYDLLAPVPAVPSNDVFEDTDNTEVFKAYRCGIVKGVAPTSFDPYSPITRETICTMITRCIESAIETSTVYSYTNHEFADGYLISDWAWPSVNYAVDHNVVNGVGNNEIDPQGTVTSEEAICLVNRVYENRDTFEGETESFSASETFSSGDGSLVESVKVEGQAVDELGEIIINNDVGSEVMVKDTAGSLGSGFSVSVSEPTDRIKRTTVRVGYNSSGLSAEDEQNIAIARYDNSRGRMMLLNDTRVDAANDTVSATDTQLGAYVLVNQKTWYEEWLKNQTVARSEQTDHKDFDVVFLMDDSYSMDEEYMMSNSGIHGSDPNNIRKSAIFYFIRALEPDDGFDVISFYDSDSDVTGYNLVSEITDWSTVQNQIESTTVQSGTNISGAVSRGISILDGISRDSEKIIVLLTDGNHDSKSASYDENEVVKAAAAGYKIYTIGLGESADVELLKQIADDTGGKYYPADNADSLVEVFKRIKGENIGWDTIDSDNDGIYDAVEENGMRTQYGTMIVSDPMRSDTDSDTLTDGDEVGKSLVYDTDVTETDIINGIHFYCYYKVNSDPGEKDSDGDGIIDYDDSFPLTKIKYENGIDKYISQKYGDKLTLALMVNQAKNNSDTAVAGLGSTGHSFIRLERYADTVSGDRTKEIMYLGFCTNDPDCGLASAFNKKQYAGTIRNDFRASWTVAQISEITQSQAEEICAKYVNGKFHPVFYQNNANAYEIDEQYQLVDNNCTTWAANIYNKYNSNGLSLKPRDWNISWAHRIGVELLYSDIVHDTKTNVFTYTAFGYNPGLVGEDLRSSGKYIENPNNDGKNDGTEISASYVHEK